MPRERSPNRDKACEIFLANKGEIANREIANQLGIPEKTVSGWKVKDSWVNKLNGVLQTNERSTPKHAGAPKGNKNAVGNSGGPGGPSRNDHAVSHGFFRRIFPDDEETLSIIDEIGVKSPIEMLWENIVIQYTAIVRAQKIMFVRDNEDHSDFQTKSGSTSMGYSEEHERQYAWDKQATFLQAQSRAISTLEGLISRFEAMLPDALKVEEQRVKIEKMRAEIDKLRGGSGQDDEGINITVDYGDGNE